MFLLLLFLILFPVLNQIGYIDWHLINVCIVKGFNVFQRTLIIISNKVDSNTFTAETSTTTNSVKIKGKKKIENVSFRSANKKRVILTYECSFLDLTANRN